MLRINQSPFYPPDIIIPVFVLFSGCAALSWEVIWQVRAALALGVSAWGTAITLAVVMGGMSAGALLMGEFLKNKAAIRPLRLYGFLECTVGLCGLALTPAFQVIRVIDTHAYAAYPHAAPVIYIAAMIAVMGLPSLCLGATLPVIGIMAKKYNSSIAMLYGLNTLGAAAGALLASFLLIPLFGLVHTVWIIAAVNLGIGVFAVIADRDVFPLEHLEKAREVQPSVDFPRALLIVSVTGFATFALEISWFRSLTAAFKSTTDAFAIMLACVLISLGLGARMAPLLRKKKMSLGIILSWAGVLILAMTPLIERFDMVNTYAASEPVLLLGKWFFMTLYTIGPPVLLLGISLPWLLDEQSSTRRWGTLYGVNALASIAGSLSAAWLLLPAMGFAKTSWIAGVLVACTGIFVAGRDKRKAFAFITLAALILAFFWESGVGKTRVQVGHLGKAYQTAKILRSYEGPDATISAVETKAGFRILVINGFVATGQLGDMMGNLAPVHYMAWMGHMPMLLHPFPQSALVICFGTGQTANAVRNENPQTLDIVDLNKRVFDMADIFTMNENVLDDPVVDKTVMDGRAYIRRTTRTYDIITLEPMPPNFAGVNSLYSREFYQLARSKLSENGTIAQWLPFHLVPPYYSASIAKTFQSVFPNAILWIDPLSGTGILLGSKDSNRILGPDMPGFSNSDLKRDMTEEQVVNAIAMNREDLEIYGQAGEIITDDNQLLSYGKAVYLSHSATVLTKENKQFMEDVTGKKYGKYFPH